MFERYTEGARRALFFALRETQQSGSPSIETEHLLLGLAREDPGLLRRIVAPDFPEEMFRRGVEAGEPSLQPGQSQDRPLSKESKRVLACSAEEAERLQDRHIRPGHLLLGLMREEGSAAARLLKAHGATLEGMRTKMAGEPKIDETVTYSRSPRAAAQAELRAGRGMARPKQDEGWAAFNFYTEKARRVIFFARFEASRFGTGAIEPEHLLLGLQREGIPELDELLGPGIPWTELRKKIEARLGPANPRISTSADLPLSDPAKRVLEYADEERDRLGGGVVNIGHLLLGLLREEQCYATELLRERGAHPGAIRAKLV